MKEGEAEKEDGEDASKGRKRERAKEGKKDRTASPFIALNSSTLIHLLVLTLSGRVLMTTSQEPKKAARVSADVEAKYLEGISPSGSPVRGIR
jgi:hypothetical protein